MVSIAQKIFNEGKEEGRREGRREVWREDREPMVIRMLEQKLDIELIAKLTDFSLLEIKELQSKLKIKKR